MRKPDVYRIPPLPASTLRKLQEIREECKQAFLNCGIPGTPYLDGDRATETIQAYAIEEFDICADYYASLEYCPQKWAIEILHRAVIASMGCFPNFQFVVRDPEDSAPTRYEEARQFFDELHNTVLLHAIRRMATGSLKFTAEASPQKDSSVLNAPNIEENGAEPGHPSAETGYLADRRKRLLGEYRLATGASEYAIYNAKNSGIYRSDFQKWKAGKMPSTSVTAQNLERFLRDKEKPIRRTPKVSVGSVR